MTKTLILYRWKIQREYDSKWITTRFLATEEDIRKTNPEAIRIEGSREERAAPDDIYTLTIGHVQSGPTDR